MSDLTELYNCFDLSSKAWDFFNEYQNTLNDFMNRTKDLNIKQFDDLIMIHKHRLIKLNELAYRLMEIHLSVVKINEDRKGRKIMSINYKYNLEQLQKDNEIIEKELKQLEDKLQVFETIEKYIDSVNSKKELNEEINSLKIVKRNIEKTIDIVTYFIEEE